MNLGSSARRPPLRDRQREEVTRAIVDATEAVIAERGVAATGMAEVARRAGVAVGTVYNHFADRDALLRELFSDRRGRIIPLVRAAADLRASTFEAELRAFVGRVLAVLDEHATFVRIALEVGSHGRDPKLHSPALVHEMRAATEKVLARRAGKAALSPRHAALHAPILLAAIKAVVTEEVAAGGSFAQHADAVVDLFLDGARRR
ncbi:MAG TPA: TetR/AcrR family transcriptional regulator [Kofleriaceae bacterium]|nr:TetR/AcrR family transcriptional regulator [Kofleriaceae bacterium]